MNPPRSTPRPRTAAPTALPTCVPLLFLLLLGGLAHAPATRAAVVFEAYSPYHHVLVLDERGTRTLSFDGTRETQMSLNNPLQGHFEYTEFFHYGWLWNPAIAQVLMLGLGGGSTQRSFLHHYPNARIDTAEIDPVVLRVATNFFGVPLNDRHQVVISDGRSFLRRARKTYDLILLDAYTKHRYGSQIPQHLATREFFELARDHLATNGVLAYNVITTSKVAGADAGLALARTLSVVFPQVYVFRARSSMNAVLVATRDPRRDAVPDLVRRAAALRAQGLNPPPGVFEKLPGFQIDLPRNTATAPILTDDFAPVESLGRRER